MDRSQLNGIYEKLDKKAREIGGLLGCSFAYYNGHYSKNKDGQYETEYFPIPVVSLKGVCDIEIGLEQITVTAKLSREKAISYDYQTVKAYPFEAYGVEDYLEDFYLAGDTVEGMIGKIKKSKEEAIFFSFCFACGAEPSAVRDFVNLIRAEGFFY